MKKVFCVSLALLLILCAAGCGKEKEPGLDLGELNKTPEIMTVSGDGWSFAYDPEFFTNPAGGSVFYAGEDSPMPVYMLVASRRDDTAEEMAEEVRRQIHMEDDTTVTDGEAVVGRDRLSAITICAERVVGELSEVALYQRFYVVEMSAGCVVIETCSYDGAPAAALEGLEAMLNSFTLE